MTLLESIARPADELPAPFAIPADLSLSGDSSTCTSETSATAQEQPGTLGVIPP